MSIFHTSCPVCGKDVIRDSGRVNESKKMHRTTYCSLKCLGLSRRNRKTYKCYRKECKNRFYRTPSDLTETGRFYCSHTCAVIFSNRENPRNPGVLKICEYCGKNFKSRKKYCSRKCKDLGSTIPADTLLSQIKDFVDKNGRIPYKREMKHYHAFRLRFGNWNNAVKIAGFDPNPVMFAKKYTALDGHRCDSMAERIIDDYLYRRNIKHERNHPYPGDKGFTVDFKVGDYWIEFFGLKGQYKRYDLLLRRKLNLVKKHHLNLLSIYPKDLFPKGNLRRVLNAI